MKIVLVLVFVLAYLRAMSRCYRNASLPKRHIATHYAHNLAFGESSR